MFDRSIDNQVSRLRRKLSAGARTTDIIKTVRGGGYLFVSGAHLMRLWPRSLAGQLIIWLLPC